MVGWLVGAAQPICDKEKDTSSENENDNDADGDNFVLALDGADVANPKDSGSESDSGSFAVEASPSPAGPETESPPHERSAGSSQVPERSSAVSSQLPASSSMRTGQSRQSRHILRGSRGPPSSVFNLSTVWAGNIAVVKRDNTGSVPAFFF